MLLFKETLSASIPVAKPDIPLLSNSRYVYQDLRKISKFHLFGRIRCGWETAPTKEVRKS